MSNYRRRNFSTLQPDPVIPKPKGVPVIIVNDCQGLDEGVYLHWEYKAADADTLNGYWVRIVKQSDRATIMREVYVSEPDTDLDVTGLVNGTVYEAVVSASNPTGESAPSKAFGFTPSTPIIPAPVLKTLTGGDGEAIASWSLGSPVEGFTYEWVSYEAVNELGATVTEHVVGGEVPNESGRCPLTNDHDWKVALVAIASNDVTKKQYVSAISNAITVHVEKPLPPYSPKLLGAQIDNDNVGYVEITFAPAIDNVTATKPLPRWRKGLGLKGRTGPGDITGWQVKVTDVDRSGYFVTYDIADPSARSYRTANRVALGGHEIFVRAQNKIGYSDWSNSLYVDFKSKDLRPFTSDKPYTQWSSIKYNYAIFDPGNDPVKGWEIVWNCVLTEPGKTISYDVLAVGAGGGGKGITATLGKGGNGGGGQLTAVYGITPTSDKFSILISIGGATAIDPKNTTISNLSSSPIVAICGKSASSGQDAAGYGKTFVDQWTECTAAFGWLTPDSQSVGGVAQDGKQGFPNGLGWGCAGAGTKVNTAGKGVEGLVVIRWAK